MLILSILAKYKPTEDPNVFDPEYHLDKDGISDPTKDGVTFLAQVEGQPPKVVFIPGCIFGRRRPAQCALYPGV